MQEPAHVAIIMDGNGRWARKRGLPRVIGHRQGVESVRNIVKASTRIGLRYLTLFTFSTENWRRPADEVSTLMDMLEEMLIKETPELHKNNVRINAIGRLDALHQNARKALQNSLDLTNNNTGLVLTLCLNYGSRCEIVDAVRKIIELDRKQRFDLSQFGEDEFTRHLYDPDLPEPDILIRTGSTKRERVSNFLLWQIAYTEIFFTDTLWPDFREKEFTGVIESFKERERLFGRVKS
jgi:undecaprenyl diphosphate synthase